MKTGDRVVCIRSHSQGAVKKGQIYTILCVTICETCNDARFDVGKRIGMGRSQCSCLGLFPNNSDTWWLNPVLFAPIVEDEFLSSDEIEKIVEEKIDIEIPVEA